jgi:hypothetical protein
MLWSLLLFVAAAVNFFVAAVLRSDSAIQPVSISVFCPPLVVASRKIRRQGQRNIHEGFSTLR